MPSSPFRRFSTGYYVGRLRVEPHDGERAVMERGQHRAANEQVYATGEGVERLDHPLVATLDGVTLPVEGAPDVPADTLGLPEDLFATTRPPRRRRGRSSWRRPPTPGASSGGSLRRRRVLRPSRARDRRRRNAFHREPRTPWGWVTRFDSD